MIKSLDATGDLVERNGGKFIRNVNATNVDVLKAVADYLNNN
jgi:hypothetical protein